MTVVFDCEDAEVEYRQPLLQEQILDVFLLCVDRKLKDDPAEVVSRDDLSYLESCSVCNEVGL